MGVGTAYGDSAYIFDMAPRPDTNHLGKPLKQQQQQQKGHDEAGGAREEEEQHQDDHGPRSVRPVFSWGGGRSMQTLRGAPADSNQKRGSMQGASRASYGLKGWVLALWGPRAVCLYRSEDRSSTQQACLHFLHVEWWPFQQLCHT